MNKVREVQESIINYVIHNDNKLHQSLFTLDHAETQITLISEHLPKNRAMIGNTMNENLMTLYKFATVSTISIYGKLILSIELPLRKNVIYQCLKVTSIPKIENDTAHEINSRYGFVLANTTYDEFYLLKKHEYKSCMSNKNEILCKVNSPKHTAKHKNCAISLFTNKKQHWCEQSKYNTDQEWKKLLEPNACVQNTTNAEIECQNERKIINIKGTGIIRVKPNCIIKTNDIEIEDVDLESTDEIKIKTMEYNGQIANRSWFTEIKVENLHTTPNLVEALEEMHHMHSLYIGQHVHHFAIGYTILFIIISFAIYFYYKFIYVKRVDHSDLVKPKQNLGI